MSTLRCVVASDRIVRLTLISTPFFFIIYRFKPEVELYLSLPHTLPPVVSLPQVKNIIYHAVKDAVGTLKAHEPKLARP